MKQNLTKEQQKIKEDVVKQNVEENDINKDL